MIREEIAEELERIRNKDREKLLRPKAVVNTARSKDNVLHNSFEWNNSKAGEEWRLHQARALISSYHVTIQSQTTTRVRGYVSLKSDRAEGGGYRAIGEVISDEELRQEMLQNAMDDLLSFEARYARLKELKPLFRLVAELREKHPKPEKSEVQASA